MKELNQAQIKTLGAELKKALQAEYKKFFDFEVGHKETKVVDLGEGVQAELKIKRNAKSLPVDVSLSHKEGLHPKDQNEILWQGTR